MLRVLDLSAIMYQINSLIFPTSFAEIILREEKEPALRCQCALNSVL